MDRAMSDTNPSNDDDSRSAVDRAGQSKHWMGDWKTSMAAPASAAATWGPYFDAEFGPPHRVRAWIAWKISSTGRREYRPAVVGSARGATRGVRGSARHRSLPMARPTPRDRHRRSAVGRPARMLGLPVDRCNWCVHEGSWMARSGRGSSASPRDVERRVRGKSDE
jgi:hypothetical protein